MSKQEFVLLIPAIIYGVAIVDLLKTFRLKVYWEIAAWGIYMLMAAIILALTLYGQLDTMASDNKALILVVVQAILFSKAASIITPEESDLDTKSYYHKNYKFFIAMVISVFAFAWLNEFVIYDDRSNTYVRPFGLVLAGVSVFWDNKWYRRIVLLFCVASAIAVLFGYVQ